MIEEKIEADLKKAMKEKNALVLSALRNLKAEMKNVAIAKGQKLADEEVIQVVNKKVRQHKDSIESFKAGGRADLEKLEQEQMTVLQQYLPKPLSEDEVQDLVKKVISELVAQPQDFGKVMKEVLSRAGGRTDGSIVSKIVKEELK
ncbi:MAG: GatB/YqeY domain-containing protein [Candidatus Doudnabacteria bacterium]|nr:GatB/YqeY domain-containing protein [Candidatus Doudnabacteria bacterium]